MTTAEYRRLSLPVRLALALAAAAGVLALAGGLLDAAAGPARGRPGATAVVSARPGLVAVCVAAGAAAAAAAALRRPWAHLTGVVAATLVAAFAAAAVVGARADEAIAARAAVELRAGGILLASAFAVGAAAVAVALLGYRRMARTPPAPTGDRPRPDPGIAARATAALATGLLSLLVPVLGGLAASLGLLAQAEIARSRNQLEGRGRAAAGIILGLFVLALVLLGGLVGVALVRPGE